MRRELLMSGGVCGWEGIVEIQTYDDLIAPGAEVGSVPSDLEHATGLERLELLGKMEGIDVFDMRPLDASRLGMSFFLFFPFILPLQLFLFPRHSKPGKNQSI